MVGESEGDVFVCVRWSVWEGAVREKIESEGERVCLRERNRLKTIRILFKKPITQFRIQSLLSM